MGVAVVGDAVVGAAVADDSGTGAAVEGVCVEGRTEDDSAVSEEEVESEGDAVVGVGAAADTDAAVSGLSDPVFGALCAHPTAPQSNMTVQNNVSSALTELWSMIYHSF